MDARIAFLPAFLITENRSNSSRFAWIWRLVLIDDILVRDVIGDVRKVLVTAVIRWGKWEPAQSMIFRVIWTSVETRIIQWDLPVTFVSTVDVRIISMTKDWWIVGVVLVIVGIGSGVADDLIHYHHTHQQYSNLMISNGHQWIDFNLGSLVMQS